VAFDVGSGPLSGHAGLVDNQDAIDTFAWIDGDTTSGNGYFLGTVAVPEPSCIWLLMGLAGGIAARRRRVQSPSS